MATKCFYPSSSLHPHLCSSLTPLPSPLPPCVRLGLDAGGGSGSFAARMALYNVTVVTTAMNIETVAGRRQGLPYMETIAARGLIPLWLPHKVGTAYGEADACKIMLHAPHGIEACSHLTWGTQ